MRQMSGRIAAALVATFVLPPMVLAQPATNESGPPAGQEQRMPARASDRYFLELGAEAQITFEVRVWGQVVKPGIYRVPDGTNVVGLLSAAGGPSDGASLSSVRLVRNAEGAAEPGVVRVDVDEYLRSGNGSAMPALTPGDVVYVPANGSHRFLRVTGVLTLLTLAANVVVAATRN